MLEQGGECSLEKPRTVFYPHLDSDKARKRVWDLVDILRGFLGWKASILNVRRAYKLDTTATWVYDIAQARANKNFTSEFLTGVYSEWVIETREELSNLKS